MVIGTAFILDAAITNAKIGLLAVDTGNIANLAVTDGKIATLGVGKLTAGTISSKAITLAVAGGAGDVYIASGKTDFTNTDAGFILGVDDSDSDKAKLYIGDSTKFLNWDGAALTIQGKIQTAATGRRIVVDPATNSLVLYDSGGDARVDINDNSGLYVTVVGDDGEYTTIGAGGMMGWYDAADNLIIQAGLYTGGSDAGMYVQRNTSSIVVANTAGTGYSGLYADSTGVIHIGTTGYVNAVGGFKDNGTAGIDGTCTVKVGGVDKTLTFSGGLITGLA
jgi:hypothetical protein